MRSNTSIIGVMMTINTLYVRWVVDSLDKYLSSIDDRHYYTHPGNKLINFFSYFINVICLE